MSRLLYIVTHAQSAGLLGDQMKVMQRAGFRVGFASAPGLLLKRVAAEQGVDTLEVPMVREIAPLSDLKALMRLVRIMHQWKPEVVYAATPKAGLLGMLAARLSRVPVRLYGQWGLRLETTRGLKRSLLKISEEIAAASSHQVLAVSRSLADLYVALGITSAENVRVLAAGSSKGVEFDCFAHPNEGAVREARERLGFPDNAPVIGFVGRFTRDKGIVELVEAVECVREHIPGVRLLLVGDFETGDPVPETTVKRIHAHPDIVRAGRVTDPAPYYALMDVLAFPSYREGFPNVPLEAAAAGLPVVGFRATGTVDAVVDGLTGMLVEIGDIEGLSGAFLRYLQDEPLRQAHGEAGRKRAREEFQPERIWEALMAEYERLLAAAGRPLPTPGGQVGKQRPEFVS